MTCPGCQKVIPDDSAWCPSCGATFRSTNPGGLMLRAAMLLLVAVSLAACGSDPALEAQPAQPRPDTEYPRPPAPGEGVVAVHEVCTVTLLEDGTVQCSCEVVQ